jgi:hypothetical protein
VSFTDFLPRLGLLEKPVRKHRAPDEIERLNVHLTGARLLIKGLQSQLSDAEANHAEVIARIDERHGEIVRGLEQQIADLERRLGIACQANAAADMTQEFDARGVRDHFAAGVLTLQQAHGIGPVRNPGRIYTEEVSS